MEVGENEGAGWGVYGGEEEMGEEVNCCSEDWGRW